MVHNINGILIHHFKGGEPYEIITPIFDIEPHTNYVEISINGTYRYYEFNNDHTIREKIVYNLCPIISPA